MTGNEYRQIRKAIGKTQTELAKLLNYSHYQRIAEIERSKKVGKQAEWKIKTLLKLLGRDDLAV